MSHHLLLLVIVHRTQDIIARIKENWKRMGKRTELVRYGMLSLEPATDVDKIIFNSLLAEIKKEYPDYGIKNLQILGRKLAEKPGEKPTLMVFFNFNVPTHTTERAIRSEISKLINEKLSVSPVGAHFQLVTADVLRQFVPKTPFYIIPGPLNNT